MDNVAVGFWGAYFGAVSLLLAGALLAFTRSARRVAFTGSLAALLSALYVLVFLGWVPLHDAGLLRLQAHTAALCAAVLAILLFKMLGHLHGREKAARVMSVVGALLTAVLVTGWLLPAEEAFALAVGMQGVLILLGVAGSLRNLRRGTYLGWWSVGGVAFMSFTVITLTWFALYRDRTPWWLHAASAASAMGYLLCMAAAMWVRYSYLIHVREVMVHGPSFDPITRMRSHFETNLMVGEAFAGGRGEGRPLGVIVISISNLESLEHLHGRAAYNHGLFICANRLRRIVPPGVEMGRVGDEGFLLLMPRPSAAAPLLDLAQRVARGLARPVVLGTSQEFANVEAGTTNWVADVGVGVLIAPPDMRPAVAVSGARAMSQTAWSYASRVACYDESSRQITELPGELAPAR